jgi:hypothetical protein
MWFILLFHSPKEKEEGILIMANTCGCGSAETSCCGGATSPKPAYKKPWMIGTVDSPIGPIPTLSTNLTWRDHLGGWKVRWCVGRMEYSIKPDLYAIGKPSPDSPVLVTANYKLSLDALRRELKGIDAWILVLDTKGVNVWCAAGKGTFGTDELVKRITAVRLSEVVHHHRIILPQLGAPGVAAQLVTLRTGFSVDYGPVRAKDIPAYLAAGRKATAEMRRVTFDLRERLTVVPVEIVQAWKSLFILAVILAMMAAIGGEHVRTSIGKEALTLLGAFLTGTLLTAALLPWIPFRAFALKGFILGLAWTGWAAWFFHTGTIQTVGSLLLYPGFSAFLAMNFTGDTTFTSPTGAMREVKIATPIILAFALVGTTLKLIAAGLAIS